MNTIHTFLLVLLLHNPHILKRTQRRQQTSSHPRRLCPLRRRVQTNLGRGGNRHQPLQYAFRKSYAQFHSPSIPLVVVTPPERMTFE